MRAYEIVNMKQYIVEWVSYKFYLYFGDVALLETTKWNILLELALGPNCLPKSEHGQLLWSWLVSRMVPAFPAPPGQADAMQSPVDWLSVSSIFTAQLIKSHYYRNDLYNARFF